MNASSDLDPHADSDAQLPRWFGDYVLLKRLGHGGMGQVFLARLPGLQGIDRLCVIKTLRTQWTNDREYVARFVDEARVVVQLNHRNICPVFDVGQHRQTYYLAMDLVPGRDLQAVLQRAQHRGIAVPVDVALQLVAEVVDALDAAHRLTHLEDDSPLNLVHRDVSPHNVLVSFDGEVKLIDFGLAQSALKAERTEPGVVLGKMAYMAPEHARGEAVDRRADLFAAGVLLYELMVGDRYWGGMSVQQIWQTVGTGGHRPAGLASVDADVRAVIVKATAANPDDRYATGAEMRQAMVRVQIARGVVAGSTEVRAFMEHLFAGEALADRKERAALQKQPAPPPLGVQESTRIAVAPGAPLAPPPSLPPLQSSLLTVPDIPAVIPRASAPMSGDELPTLSERTQTAARTTRTPRSMPSSMSSLTPPPPPARRWPFAIVAVAVVVVVVAAMTFGGTDEPPPVEAPVVAVEAPIVAVEAPVVVPVVVEPPPVVVEPASEPVTEPAVAVIDAPTKPKTPKPKAAPTKPPPPVSRPPLPAKLPRLLDDKVALLSVSCVGVVPCARHAITENARWGQLSHAESEAHKQTVDTCLEQCRLTSSRP